MSLNVTHDVVDTGSLVKILVEIPLLLLEVFILFDVFDFFKFFFCLHYWFSKFVFLLFFLNAFNLEYLFFLVASFAKLTILKGLILVFIESELAPSVAILRFTPITTTFKGF